MGRNETVMGVRVGVMVVGMALCGGVCSCDLKQGAAGNGCEVATEGAAATQAGADAKGEAQTRVMVVEVVDGKTGKGLAGVSVRAEGFAGKKEFAGAGKSDEAGKVMLELPRAGVTYCHVWAEKDGYVPMRAQWPAFNTPMTGQALKLPESYRLEMPEGTQIGGRVVDDGGKGVEGATVALLLGGRRREAMNQAVDVIFRNVKTGADGKWSYGQAPEDFSEAEVGAYHMAYDSGKGYGWFAMNEIGTKELKGGTAVITLNRGVRVEGRVVDGEGKGVAGAVIGLGNSRFGSNSLPDVMSDKEGYFGVCGPVDGKLMVTVKAKGFAPELKTLELGKEKESVEFVMKPGKTLKGRVVDSKGAGIQGVRVVVDTWREARTLDTRMTTDGQGRFEWKEAPEDEVLFDIIKMGYGDLRDKGLKAGDEEVTITMMDPTVVTGSVVDEETGKVIEEFTVTPGSVYEEAPGRTTTSWDRDERGLVKGKDGVFRFNVGYPRPGHVVRIEAKGYAPQDSRVYRDGEGRVELAFKLKKAKNVEGVVRGVDGKAAAGVEVVLIGSRSQVRWAEGRLEKGSRRDLVSCVSDEAGRYWFVPQSEAFVLVVMDDRGYAEVEGEDAVKNGDVQMKPWGRVEGRLMRGSRPAGMLEVYAGRDDAYATEKPEIINRIQTKADGEGRFVIERVPPVTMRVFMAERFSSGKTVYTQSEVIDVAAGGTTPVTVGGAGRPVTGKVEIPEEIKARGEHQISATLGMKWETLQPKLPEGAKAMTLAQRQAWYREFMQSGQGKALLKAQAAQRRAYKGYPFEVKADGTFRIEDVMAGEYKLTIYLKEIGANDVLAEGEMKVVVPEMAGGRSDEALDVGVVSVRGGEEKGEGGR